MTTLRTCGFEEACSDYVLEMGLDIVGLIHCSHYLDRCELCTCYNVSECFLKKYCKEMHQNCGIVTYSYWVDKTGVDKLGYHENVMQKQCLLLVLRSLYMHG